MAKDIKDDRKLKIKTMEAIRTIKNELNNRKLKFKEYCGLFTVIINSNEFLFELDGGENINTCWTNLSDYKSFELCESYLNLEEFLMQLDQIIEDFNKLIKIRAKVEKKIREIEDIINNSGIEVLEIDEIFFDDLLFENIISATEI